jgi:hypothetical protein
MKDDATRALVLADQCLKDHVLKRDIPSRCFEFRTESGASAYWFFLTWTPGHLSLVGDIGEVTLTSPACDTLENALAWAHRGDVDYLIGKSDKDRCAHLDVRATYDMIVALANEAARPDERLAGWREFKASREDWMPEAVTWALALDAWGGVDEDAFRRRCFEERLYGRDLWHALPDPPEPMDELPGYDEVFPRTLYTARDTYQIVCRGGSEPMSQDRMAARWYPGCAFIDRRVFDGWEAWDALNRVLDVNVDRDAIYSAADRREIRNALDAYLTDASPEQVAELCAECGFDDFFGVYDYGPRAYWQVSAIKKGAALLVEATSPDPHPTQA